MSTQRLQKRVIKTKKNKYLKDCLRSSGCAIKLAQLEKRNKRKRIAWKIKIQAVNTTQSVKKNLLPQAFIHVPVPSITPEMISSFPQIKIKANDEGKKKKVNRPKKLYYIIFIVNLFILYLFFLNSLSLS